MCTVFFAYVKNAFSIISSLICASLKRSATALGFKSACAEPNIQIVGFAYVKTTFTLLYVTVRIDQNPENPEAF